MTAFNVCLIGSGIISKAHAEAARASRRVRVAAVADPDLVRAGALGRETGAPAFPSLAELLRSPVSRELDGAVICTPPSVRIDLVEEALAAGLAVLVEKPLAHTLADAERLASIATAAPDDAATRLAFCHRFTPAIVEMKRRADAGELGELVRFENTFACWHPTMQTRWMSDPAHSGGGSLIDTGSHGLDLFHFLVGPAQAECVVQRHGWDGRGDTNATLLVRSDPTGLAAGDEPAVAGVIACGWAEPPRFTVTLVGTRGLLHYDFDQPETLLFQSSQGERATIATPTHELRFQHQLEAFADHADEPAAPTVLASFEDGLAVARLLHTHDMTVL